MRWLSYFILAYVIVGLHVGVSAFMRVHETAPNFILMAAVFLAINAPGDSARLACFMLGLLADLVTQQPMGLFALSFGLMGMILSNMSKVVYRGHPLAHFSLCLMGGTICAVVMWFSGVIHGMRTPFLTLMGGVLYTALLAPVVIGILQRLRGLFGFDTGRRRIS